MLNTEKMMDLNNLYKNCRLCPRNCCVDRLAVKNGCCRHGYCHEEAGLRLSFAGLHSGEEPPLSGKHGSGTIFVAGCNLSCALCQNWQISGRVSSGCGQKRLGREVSTGEFAAICLKLQNLGATNINIVTGSHAVPAIINGLEAAKTAGLCIPVLWNSSGYENIETLKLLSGIVDIWLPDLKTLNPQLSALFFNASDYPEAAQKAILWMLSLGKPDKIIIRHLILPGYLESSREVLRWFSRNAAGKAQLSLMSQYTPVSSAGPQRFLSKHEYNTVIGWLLEFGIEDGFCQEYVTESDWLPDFSRVNPFSSELSVPVWHYTMDVLALY